MVRHLGSFCNIEVGGEMHETPFQSFEVVNVEMVAPARELKNANFLMVSWKHARTDIEDGFPEGWGRVLGFLENKELSDLGYNSQTV